MIAGALALWGANTFFGGGVAGMFIVPALICIPIGLWGMWFGKDEPASWVGTSLKLFLVSLNPR